MRKAIWLAGLMVATIAVADVLVKNQGTTVGPVTTLNCGTRTTCTRSGAVATITADYVDAGGTFNLWDEGVDAGTVSGLSCIGPGVTCTRVGTQAALYVDAGVIVTEVLTATYPLCIKDDGGTVNLSYMSDGGACP